ncbi:hypothetical protein ML462_15460 [Gramella lutea]|uniref:EF-hand domain-containing protein n=1 Tax=Christiangramia lutea TaxID=1607951 RepID=A0A9X1V668_9FLAO|nr:hypothetical protein [Christiangramia lutea]MCH4824570.1 hypothetical protein [Christiangramia lutea]
MRKLTLILLIIFSITSCKNDDKPTVDYNQKKDKKAIVRDTSKIVINDLPVEIDSTEYVIYVTGEPQETYYGSSYSGLGSRSSNSNSFSVISSYNADIPGSIFNLKFQKRESDSITSLTDQIILITSVKFLREIFNQNKKQYLIYTVYDDDTNGDQKINSQDLSTLYLSKINGKAFEKITPENQEIIDYNIIKLQNRLYFRTIEDIDKDGKFDNEDKIHHFYIDFDNEELKPKEYDIS